MTVQVSDDQEKSIADGGVEKSDDADAVKMEQQGSSEQSGSVPSFHTPVPASGGDVDALSAAEQLALDRMHDRAEESKFELAQRLKKSVVRLLACLT